MRRFLAISAFRVITVTASVVSLLLVIVALAVRQPTFSRPPFRPRHRASGDALEREVLFLASLRRDADRCEELDKAADHIHDAFARAGCRTSEQLFMARRRRYRNVVCRFDAGNNLHPLVIVGAHYDTFGGLPGADDNASGTAGLIELARLIGAQRPGHSIELVAYSTEEPPFFGSDDMGSSIHAESVRRRSSVKAMICLEMIGYFGGSQRWDSWLLGAMYPAAADFIGVAGGWNDRSVVRRVKAAMLSSGNIRVVSFCGPRSMLDASDQRNYWSRGYTAVMVTDTAYQRNPNYHTAGDVPQTLNYKLMAAVVDGVFNAVLELGSG